MGGGGANKIWPPLENSEEMCSVIPLLQKMAIFSKPNFVYYKFSILLFQLQFLLLAKIEWSLSYGWLK